MKKFTTKLLMSIIAVAFAFVALGTSTYAWFSMNTTVTVTGMEIGAKSNNTYLLIGESSTVSAIRSGNATAVAFNPAESATVLPSKPKQASEVAADGTAINATSIADGKYFVYGTDVVEDATSAAVAANWYTAVSHNPSQALAFESGADFKSLNDTDNDPLEFSKYVLKETVYLALAEGSDAAYRLTVTPTITIKDNQTATNISAVKVLVAVGDQLAFLSTTSGARNLYTADTDNVLSGDTVLQADIYIYYDGSETYVTTNHAADLAAATVELEFNVSLKPAQ